MAVGITHAKEIKDAVLGKPKNMLVVAINPGAIFLMCLQRSYGKYRVKKHQTLPMGGEARFPWLEDKTLSERIGAFVLQNRLSTEFVILSIRAGETITTYLELPGIAGDDAESMIAFEMEKHIPLPLEDVHYGYWINKVGGSDGTLEVMSAAIEKTALEQHIKLLEEAGLNPSAICLDVEGHVKGWLERESGREKTFVLLKLRPGEAQLCLVDGGILKYFRNIPRNGGISFTSVVKRELRAAAKFAQEHVGGGISFVAVSGGEEKDRLAVESLEGELGIKVLLPPPPSFEKTAGTTGIDQWELSSAVAIAGAVAEGEKFIDLLPRRHRDEKNRRNPVTGLRVLLFIAFLVLGMVFNKANSERAQLTTINEELKSLEGQVLQIEELRSQVDAYLSKLSTFEDLKLKELRKLDLLREMTIIIPPTVWLSVLIYEDGKLDISGFAESASGLIPIMEESDYFLNARFIAPIVQRPWGEEFKIRADVER